MTGRGLVLLALFALVGQTANAQEADRSGVTSAEQLSRTSSGLQTSASQISRGAALDTASQNLDRSLPPPPSSSEGRSARSAPQLTGERGRTDAGVQLTEPEPSAGPAPSPAARRAGLNTATEQPQGADRCDPRAERQDARVCARVIEARAADFPLPDPQPLSAEQRLMNAQRQPTPMSRDVGMAARRLADGELDESNAALAVASLTFGQGVQPDREEEEQPSADTSVTDAIVAGVLAAVGQQPR